MISINAHKAVVLMRVQSIGRSPFNETSTLKRLGRTTYFNTLIHRLLMSVPVSSNEEDSSCMIIRISYKSSLSLFVLIILYNLSGIGIHNFLSLFSALSNSCEAMYANARLLAETTSKVT